MTTILRQVRIDSPAHGGHAVARHEGRVIFVRHTAPGELVDVRVDDDREDARFWRGEAIAIHEPSPDRVEHVWPQAGAGGVGGAELGHLTLAAQREWKRRVLIDTLRRIGHLEVADITVHAAPGDDERNGLGTRTRVELTVNPEGRLAMNRPRSHSLVALETMPLAVDEIQDDQVWYRGAKAGSRIDIMSSASGVLVLQDGEPLRGSRTSVRHKVLHTLANGDVRPYEYRVAATGFWQVHREAPTVLVERVVALAGLNEGERVLELYSGAGLLTRPLADAVTSSGGVVAIEGDHDAVRNARRNAHGYPWIQLVEGDVASAFAELDVPSADVVVLDPPRAGAGADVTAAVLALEPRRIVYVACDPASLARDGAALVAGGYDLVSVEGHDLFPHTHHVEAIAVFDRIGSAGEQA